MPRKRVTICVLTYGTYYRLARRILQSILQLCRREDYELVVGANAVCKSTLHYLNDLKAAGYIDRIDFSPRNLNKCPMMRRMFHGIQNSVYDPTSPPWNSLDPRLGCDVAAPWGESRNYRHQTTK